MGNREALLYQIKQAYEARGRGAIEDLMAAFHPDAVFTLVGDRNALEVTGSVHGHRSVRDALAGFIASFDFVERQILSELVEGDSAAVHSRIVVRYKPKGTTHTTEVLDWFRFQEGKIVELVEFADTALIRDMMS
jgi:ketosteroid isomerase-like protein